MTQQAIARLAPFSERDFKLFARGHASLVEIKEAINRLHLSLKEHQRQFGHTVRTYARDLMIEQIRLLRELRDLLVS